MAEADVFSGTVLVEKNGQTLLKDAYGFANRSDRGKNTVRTRFNLGSGNKLLTAIAVVQLAEQGKVAFLG
jgi:D-alanyl-D-alanine carboxypeptidase